MDTYRHCVVYEMVCLFPFHSVNCHDPWNVAIHNIQGYLTAMDAQVA